MICRLIIVSSVYLFSLYKRILSRQDRRVNILALFVLLSKQQWPCLLLRCVLRCILWLLWSRWLLESLTFRPRDVFFGSSHIDGCLFYIYDDIKCTLGWLCPFVVTYGFEKTRLLRILWDCRKIHWTYCALIASDYVALFTFYSSITQHVWESLTDSYRVPSSSTRQPTKPPGCFQSRDLERAPFRATRRMEHSLESNAWSLFNKRLKYHQDYMDSTDCRLPLACFFYSFPNGDLCALNLNSISFISVFFSNSNCRRAILLVQLMFQINTDCKIQYV